MEDPEWLCRVRDDPNFATSVLVLRGKFMGDGLALRLAKVLERNTTITSLSLEQNSIGAQGATALASGGLFVGLGLLFFFRGWLVVVPLVLVQLLTCWGTCSY
jgi:hypothetical protein